MNGVKHMALSASLFFALTSMMLAENLNRHCTEEPITTPTRWGGNERIVIDFRDKPVRTITGIVKGPGEGTLKTLVQVFSRKASDPLSRPPDQENEIPVAACITGDDGVFGFSLRAGEYELRMSQNPRVDVTSVFVKVKHGWHRSRKIKVPMHVGT